MTLRRLPILLFGCVLLMQGLGKVADPGGYAAALAVLDAVPEPLLWPVAVLWMALELCGGAVLASIAVSDRPQRALAIGAACAGVTVCLAYTVVIGQAWLRGLDVKNCTCFGTFAGQEVGLFVVAQDVIGVAWSLWVLQLAHTVAPPRPA